MNRKRSWWRWLLVGFVALVVVAALGDDDKPSADGDSAGQRPTATAPSDEGATATTTAPAEPTQTLADARRAVDVDDYAAATDIASGLGSREADAIGRRIANRLGRRASAAITAGDRGRARALIIDASRYPSTTEIRRARASYRAAKARAARRRAAAAELRRAAAEQRRAAAEQRRLEQAQRAAPEPQADCDSNYSGCVPSYPPDVNCPQVDGPVQVTGSDPHRLDRDGDGVACEG